MFEKERKRGGRNIDEELEAATAETDNILAGEQSAEDETSTENPTENK